MRPHDTTPEAWAILEDGIRNMTPAQRVRRAIGLTILAHGAALAQIRRSHPNEAPERHRLRLAARMIDRETMRRAFHYDDDGS